MTTEPITIRDRLRDYEFTEGQEITLTLELLNRIEKDIDEQRARKTRDGFSERVALAGLAAALFLLLGELNKLNHFSFLEAGVVFLGGLLILKIPWAFYQLLAIDKIMTRPHEKGRFFWSNDLFFEHRIAGAFQLLVFAGCVCLLFLVTLPIWVSVSTGLAFLLYVFILGMVFVLSFKKEAFSPLNSNKLTMAGLPALFLAATAISLVGLISQMKVPVGSDTSPYAVAGLLLTVVFFVDRVIRLSTPSVLLEKLERLRYDIIFLKAGLTDAWTRYEVAAFGHDISEELRASMDDIIRSFNTLDYGQSQKEKSLSAIEEDLHRLEEAQEARKLTESDFARINVNKVELFSHVAVVKRLFEDLQPLLETLAKDIQKISRSTQQWQRADRYHQYITSRVAAIDQKDKEIGHRGAEAQGRWDRLLPQAANTHKK